MAVYLNKVYVSPRVSLLIAPLARQESENREGDRLGIDVPSICRKRNVPAEETEKEREREGKRLEELARTRKEAASSTGVPSARGARGIMRSYGLGH